MSKETKIKIIGTGFFAVLLLGTLFLIYHTNKIERNEVIETVVVAGNNLLNQNDYLSFTKLSDLKNNDNLTLPLIKSRFEKHPYVLKADVNFINEKEVRVFITEKEINAVIIQENKLLFAAEGLQILPVFPNTKMSDMPVLSNIDGIKNLEPLKRVISQDIQQAFKIIDASKLTNAAMLKDLVEINLRNGGDVVLTFSGLNIPIIFGRGNEAEKIVSLETLLTNYFGSNNMLTESEYIDLRFYNDIYIGKMKKIEL
jgi:cell division protein FtsQ